MRQEIAVLAFARSALPAGAIVPSTREERGRSLAALSRCARERLLLVTCERLEVYTFGAEPGSVLQTLAAELAQSPHDLAAAAVSREGSFAARHLLRVASGLESRLIGEPQILAQVRQAFQEGEETGAIGAVLGALTRAAVHTGKRARSETGLGRAPSVVTMTLARLSREFRGLRKRSVLVVGTGPLAVDIAKALKAAGVSRLLIASRSSGRAAALASRVGGLGLIEADIESVQGLDAIVTCTNHRVRVQGSATFIVDLGAPPNVSIDDPALAQKGIVRLSDLSLLVRDWDSRSSAVAAAEALIADGLQRFLRWRHARAAYVPDARREVA